MSTSTSRPLIVVAAALAQPQLAVPLLDGARRALSSADVDVRVLEVAGCFELPLACQHAFRANAAAVVATGAILDDGTPHGVYLASTVTALLAEAALTAGRPVGLGVVTVTNLEQGLNRVGLPTSAWDKGGDAARAVLTSLDALAGFASTAWE